MVSDLIIERLETPLPPSGGTEPPLSRVERWLNSDVRTPEALKLETRGVTQQKKQLPLWAKQTIHKNSVAAKLRSIGEHDLAIGLETCHTSFTVAQCRCCHKHQSFPNRCDRFYCPECQPRLSRDREKAVKWWTETIDQPKHTVLTVKNVGDLTSGHVRQLKKWFTQLRRSKFASAWTGGFYSIEVTNEGRGWHLHIHALINARYIDQFLLSEKWAKITNGLGRIVKVNDARRVSYLKEVTKYAVKGNQLAAWSPEQIRTFIEAFDGVRTFGVFGELYGKRTQWKEWLKTITEFGTRCECGSSDFWFFSELEWIQKDLIPVPDRAPRPPPDLQVTFHLP